MHHFRFRFARRVAVLSIAMSPAALRAQAPADTAGIQRFNTAFADATHHMDTAASVALWEEDGISLLPSAKPIIGRKAIGAFITSVTAQFPLARMESFESQCFNLEIAGPWASEWCTEHQVVQLAPGRKFDGRGKMLLVLHRGADGVWRLSREMWNEGAPPES